MPDNASDDPVFRSVDWFWFYNGTRPDNASDDPDFFKVKSMEKEILYIFYASIFDSDYSVISVYRE